MKLTFESNWGRLTRRTQEPRAPRNNSGATFDLSLITGNLSNRMANSGARMGFGRRRGRKVRSWELRVGVQSGGGDARTYRDSLREGAAESAEAGLRGGRAGRAVRRTPTGPVHGANIEWPVARRSTEHCRARAPLAPSRYINLAREHDLPAARSHLSVVAAFWHHMLPTTITLNNYRHEIF